MRETKRNKSNTSNIVNNNKIDQTREILKDKEISTEEENNSQEGEKRKEEDNNSLEEEMRIEGDNEDMKMIAGKRNKGNHKMKRKFHSEILTRMEMNGFTITLSQF